VMVLKRLSDAARDADNILALVRGSAVNQDGRTAGIAAPNAAAQRAVIREALDKAGVAPGDVAYVEAHGTGTALGDPMEIEAIRGALGDAGGDAAPCLLGSVKANIGHLENASGMAGLAKAILCLQHREIPAQIHLTELNPRIALAGTRFEIPRRICRAWRQHGGQTPGHGGVAGSTRNGLPAGWVLSDWVSRVRVTRQEGEREEGPADKCGDSTANSQGVHGLVLASSVA